MPHWSARILAPDDNFTLLLDGMADPEDCVLDFEPVPTYPFSQYFLRLVRICLCELPYLMASESTVSIAFKLT